MPTTTICSIQRCQGRHLFSSATKTHFFLPVFLVALFAAAADSALSNDGGPKPASKFHPLPLPPPASSLSSSSTTNTNDESAASTIKNGSSNPFPAGKPSAAALNLNGHGGGGSTKVISAAITAGNRARQQQATSTGLNDTFKVQELHPLPPPPPASALTSSSSDKNDSSSAPTIGNGSSKLERLDQFSEHNAMESLGLLQPLPERGSTNELPLDLSQPLPLPEHDSANNNHQSTRTTGPISGGTPLPAPLALPPPSSAPSKSSFQTANTGANGTMMRSAANTLIKPPTKSSSSTTKNISTVSTKQQSHPTKYQSKLLPEPAINNNNKDDDFLASSSKAFKYNPASNTHQPQQLPKPNPPGLPSPPHYFLVKSTAPKSSQHQKNKPSSPKLTFHTRIRSNIQQNML